MAKYIIEVPSDLYEGRGTLRIPVKVGEGSLCWYNTHLKAESYTEPDRKAIDLQHAHDIENVARMNYSKGTEDAWEFARRIICPSDCCEDSISAYTKEIFNKEGWKIRGIFSDLSYQEAKAKYEAWLRQKVYKITGIPVGTLYDRYYRGWSGEKIVKKCVNEVAELLKKMREE